MRDYELITIDEVAKLLRVSERTVYDWAQKGEIPCGKFGTSWRFRKAEIIKWIDKKLKSPSKPTLKSAIKISSVLAKERIVFLDESNKEEALVHLVEVLSTAKEIHNKEELLAQIFRREELMSTGIGMGIGIPHARLTFVDDLVAAFGICRKPIIDYQTLDNIPVRLIIMIVAHTDQHAKYIKTLSSLTRVLRDESLYNSILSATTKDQVYDLLSGDSSI